MRTPKRISDIVVCSNGIISFECTSEMYGITDAGGKAADALKNGFVSLGDGCDYVLNEEDKAEIKKQIKQSTRRRKMDPVKRLMAEYGVDEKIAQRAWDACCDGEYLSQCDALSEVDDDIDPWDGAHEDLRREVESDAIEEARKNAIQEEKNSQQWPFGEEE